jgi:hypothetical protein
MTETFEIETLFLLFLTLPYNPSLLSTPRYIHQTDQRIEVCTGPFFQARPGSARPGPSVTKSGLARPGPARPVFVSSIVGPGRPGPVVFRPGPAQPGSNQSRLGMQVRSVFTPAYTACTVAPYNVENITREDTKLHHHRTSSNPKC